MRRIIFIAISFICCSFVAQGQTKNVYDLLTEPSISRPLTLHKGFLQLYGGYSHLNSNTIFDQSGVRLPFTERGISMIENSYSFEMSYGILEHLEFSAGIGYKNRFETEPTYYIDNRPGISSEDRTYHQYGISNLDLKLKYRLPEIVSGLDLLIFGGILTPVSSQHTKIPTHSIVLEDESNPSTPYQVYYEFNPAAGSPAVFYNAGLQVKYVKEKIGFSGKIQMQNPFSDVETYTWVTRRYGEEFVHWKLWHFMHPKGMLYGNAQVVAQVYPWFAVNAGYDYFMETPGWTNISGQEVSLTTSSAGFIKTGFEIQVSTHLRILQQLYIPVNGKNTYSDFNVSLAVVYNMVPLKNKYY